MTSKRALSDSSESDSFVELSDSESASTPSSHQIKKLKSGDVVPEQAMIITDPIHADLRTAINIKKALDKIACLQELGYCPTKARKFCKDYHIEEFDDNEEPETPEFEGQEQEPALNFKERDLTNQDILNELKPVYEDTEALVASHACGVLDSPSRFHLVITRPGCEYDGDIRRYYSKIAALLPAWFEHSVISGYGDMQALETKVDPDVRNAREIPASEFSVKPELLNQIQKKWGSHFLPRKVRAEPYKIHLYGPGGHFKSHRDTPETGLVGTFLVGLGDTSTGSRGNFHIADKTLKAGACHWVAFHPDVPHKITKVEGGYRAVMAFKIFRVADNKDEILPAQLEARVKKVLDRIPVPFGLFMMHQYSIGTTSLNGFDALIAAYSHSRNDIQARMLPVVTTFSGEVFYRDLLSRGYENYAKSRVFPFTTAHVDILLKKNVAQAEKQVKWLEGFSKIPFYSLDIKSMEAWKEDHPNGMNYTGNEADSVREDSVYFSYAILFLPQSSD